MPYLFIDITLYSNRLDGYLKVYQVMYLRLNSGTYIH